MAGTTKKPKTLHEKLFDLQGAIDGVKKDSVNPFFNSKYFDINKIIRVLKPELQERGLLLIQPIENNSVVSRIIDVESGESVESSIMLSENVDAQKRGSEVSYYRRYTLQSLLALSAEDDDGASVSGSTNQQKGSSFDDW